MESSEKSFTFRVMCPGGVIGDTVFNKVTDNVALLKNGSAPTPYKDICPVK